MLKGIPYVLSPDLLQVLSEMGEGDQLTIGDAFFASRTLATNHLVRADGVSAFTMLDAILQLMPLSDKENAVIAMGFPGADGKIGGTPTTEEFARVISRYDSTAATGMQFVDRLAFYDLAKKTYAVLATGDGEMNGCLIITKGNVEENQ